MHALQVQPRERAIARERAREREGEEEGERTLMGCAPPQPPIGWTRYHHQRALSRGDKKTQKKRSGKEGGWVHLGFDQGWQRVASRLLSHKRQTSRVCRHLGTEASARNHCALTCGLSSRGDMCAYVNIKHHHVKVDAFQPHSCQHNMRWLATDAREGTDVVVPGPHRCPCHRGGPRHPLRNPSNVLN